MAKLIFLDPVDQSAHDTLNGEIKKKEADITIWLKQVSKDYANLTKDHVTSHEDKYCISSNHYKCDWGSQSYT